MKKEKYTKTLNCPVREEMFLQIQKICENEDIPISVFIRDALKDKIKEILKDAKN